MNNVGEVIRKLLHPGRAATVALVLASAAGLAWCFLLEGAGTPLSYGVYLLSTYALVVVVILAIPLVQAALTRVLRIRFVRAVVENEALRSGALGVWSVVYDLAYATFTLATGFVYDSGWAVAVALYHVAVAVVGFLLAFGFARARRLDGVRRRVRELKMARTCGVMLLLLALTLTAVMVHMVVLRQAWLYDTVTVITNATFVFVSLVSAIIKATQVRRLDSPALVASRAASLSKTLVKLFFLQTTMIAVFGESDGETFRFVMEAVTGVVVFLSMVGIAVVLIAFAARRIRAGDSAGN